MTGRRGYPLCHHRLVDGNQTTGLPSERKYIHQTKVDGVLGCPVCQVEIANLKREKELFKQKKAKVFVFLQSSNATLVALLKEDWPFDIVCDPEMKKNFSFTLLRQEAS